MIHFKVSTAPAVELFTLAEMKVRLKIDDYSTEDALLTSLIVSARQAAESYTDRAFISQTITMSFDEFTEFELMRSPVQSITSITYLDSSGVQQTLAATVYGLDTYGYPNRVVLKHGQSWPSVSAQKGGITVTYTAGYGSAASDVPNLIRDAVAVIVADYYRNRDNPVRQFPTLAERMLDTYKIQRFV